MQRSAWHLTLENAQALAIAQQQVMEYAYNVNTSRVPDSAERCNQIVVWRDRIVPVIGAANSRITLHEHLLIIIYQDALNSKQVRYLALALKTPPVSLLIRDQDQCEAEPLQSAYWGASLLSCIETNGDKIALIDFNLFG